MPGNAAGLPVIVFVEAANPAVAVHRDIQVNLVAGRAELRRVRAHERLEEGSAVRLGVQANQEVVERADYRIFASREFMELRVFQEKITLAHGAFHFHDAVAHQAAETGAGFGAVHNLFDRRIEHPAVEQRRIVATGAPFRRLHARDVLHILDALAVPLVVEGRKMVHRAVPLFVDVGVAALASIGLHEVFGRNIAAMFGLGGAGEKLALRPVTFTVHGLGRHVRI